LELKKKWSRYEVLHKKMALCNNGSLCLEGTIIAQFYHIVLWYKSSIEMIYTIGGLNSPPFSMLVLSLTSPALFLIYFGPLETDLRYTGLEHRQRGRSAQLSLM
jgi:hypothetical protein